MNKENQHIPQITWETLNTQLELFSAKLTDALVQLNILDACQKLPMDHICVRLKHNEDVDTIKIDLKKIGEVISEVAVNGREIAIIQMNEALHVGSWDTYGVELPFPKTNHTYEDGWQHVEFVLPDANNTMGGVRTAFLRTFPHLTIEELESHYAYSEDEPHADGDQLPNPTIGIKVGCLGLKFHANSIQTVVGFEK